MPLDLTVPDPWLSLAGTRRSLTQIERLLPRPITYVLAGGGAHGSVQWGLLQALDETDISPDALVGTSAGALTAAVYAEDPLAACTRLSYLWSQLNLDVLIGDSWISMVRAATRRKRALTDSAAVSSAIESILTARRFDELQLPMAAVATELATGRATAFDDGELLSALLASSAIPGILPPVFRDGHYYIDGLASANLPARLAIERGAGSIVVLDTGSRRPQPLATSPTRVVARVNRILNANQRLGQLLYAGKRVPTVVLPTADDLGAALDFRGTLKAASDTYELARDFLDDLSTGFARRRKTLKPGIYARPDRLAGNPEVAELLQPIDHRRANR